MFSFSDARDLFTRLESVRRVKNEKSFSRRLAQTCCRCRSFKLLQTFLLLPRSPKLLLSRVADGLMIRVDETLVGRASSGNYFAVSSFTRERFASY